MSDRPRVIRLGRALGRYVVRELVVPTTIALAGLTAAALTKNLLGYADLLVNRGLGASDVAAIALYQLVPVAVQVLPLAGLIGSLVGLGRLKDDLELQSLETCGVAPARLALPVAGFGAIIATLGLAGSLYAAPQARARLGAAMERISFEHPGATLRAGEVRRFGDHQLLAREVSARGDRLRGVLLWVPDVGETIFAERADVEPAGEGAITVTLQDAVILGAPDSGGSLIRSERFVSKLHDPQRPANELETSGVETASTAWVMTLAARSDGDPGARRLAATEFHRRLALPVASLIFGLLAVPLALAGQGFSRATGAVAGIGVTVLYYGLVQLGNGLLRYPGIPPAVAVWLPNAVAALCAVGLLWRGRLESSHSGRPTVRRRGKSRKGGDEGGAARWSSDALPLDRYVVALFAQMSLLAFAAILAAYLIVDVLERLQWLAEYRAEPLEVLRFYGARIPLLASRVVPMALLAATALSVSQLSIRRELLAMQACGISLARGLAPILFLAALLVPADFALNDLIVSRTNELADRIKDAEIKDKIPSLDAAEVWYRVGTQVLRAPQLAIDRGEVRDLTIYELDQRGFPRSRTDAREARHEAGGVWKLAGARRVVISEDGLQTTPAPDRIRLDGAARASIDPANVGLGTLASAIRDAESGGYDTTAWRVDLHARLAAPLACVLLPLLVVIFAIRTRGIMRPARGLLASGALGIGYILLSDVTTSLGYGGALAPALAGWAPSVALIAATPWLLWRGRR
jgi:lipopolysaccharide export system permease protein